MAGSNGSLMFQGVRPLQQAQRDLAALSRALAPVLARVVRTGSAAVSDIARDIGMSDADVRRALWVLEDSGLVMSQTYRATEDGRRATKT